MRTPPRWPATPGRQRAHGTAPRPPPSNPRPATGRASRREGLRETAGPATGRPRRPKGCRPPPRRAPG
eukprot:8845815-Lingulodinium_polyedra.AAC.1